MRLSLAFHPIIQALSRFPSLAGSAALAFLRLIAPLAWLILIVAYPVLRCLSGARISDLKRYLRLLL